MKEKFISLYNKHSDSVFRYCAFRISDRDIALDITQDAFTKYWDYLCEGKLIENDRALIFTITRNLIIDYYRKKKSISLEALAEINEDENVEEFVILEGNEKDKLELETEARFLIDKIKELPKSYQQAVYLRYVEDMNPEEIAKVLEVSVSAASVRIHRGIEELKKITGYKNN